MSLVPNPQPSWRKPFGVLAIVALIALWAFLIASAAPWMAGWPVAVQLLVYLFAGIIWILPLRPFLRWMETGRWRVTK